MLAPDGQANVIASSEPLDDGIDTQSYANVQGNLLRTKFPGYHEHAFEEADAFGDHGFMRRFEWLPPDGVAVMQIQLYYVEKGRGYTATATTPKSEYERYEFDLQDILEGLLNESVKAAPVLADDIALELPERT